MALRTYPLSYRLLFLLMAAATAILHARFDIWLSATGGKAFFRSGGGFVLVETKGITETGLPFGNIRQVIGITIVGALIMAYLANVLVACVRINRIWPSGTLLLTRVLGGLLSAMQGVPDCHIFRKAHGCCVINLSGVLWRDYIFGPPEKTWRTI